MTDGILFLLLVWLFPLPLMAGASSQAADGDITTLRDRVIASTIPDDPQGQAKIRASAARLAESLHADGTWGDVNYTDVARSNWLARAHFERVLLMAKAYRMSVQNHSANIALKSKIGRALDWWLSHDPKNPNWWHNEIGIPQLAGETALMLGAELTPQQREGIVRILKRSRWTKWTGQNLIWGVTIQIMRGLITHDAPAITQAYDRLADEIRITTAEGIQPDWSFHQHGAQLYSGGYGLNFAQDVARFASFSYGTRWQLSAEKMNILIGYLLDGERWMMRGGRIDYSVVGREIVRKGKTAVPRSWTSGPIAPSGAGYGLLRAIELLARDPVPRVGQLREWIRNLSGRPRECALSGNRAFWRSDYMVHQRAGWFASVKMFSTRMTNGELVNSEGKQSQHLSDGASFLYRDGDEYLDVFPVWDWCKVPGTTAEQGSADAKSEPGRGIGIKGKTDFVGGVSDGNCGAAAMDLRRGALAARKAWFFFDDCYVCLGAGIRCDSDQDVATSVDQCLLREPPERGEGWVHHDQVGYIFTSGEKIQMSAGPQVGSWGAIGPESSARISKKVFSLWIDHGHRPVDATYSYTALPGETVEQTKTRAAKPVLRIVCNSPDQQAVFDPRIDLLSIAFWQAGKLSAGRMSIEVDQPCLVMLRKSNRKITLAIADPTQKLGTIHVIVNGKPTTIELPQKERAGSSKVMTIP